MSLNAKKRRRKKIRRIILIIELILLMMLGGLLYVYSKFGKMNFNDLGKVKTNNLDKKTKDLLSGYTTIALYGVDTRVMGDYKNSHSDSIIVCVIDNKRKKIRLMTVYRDTYMEINGRGDFRKCNYAFGVGGAKQSIEMLNRNIDLNIQDYVAVDWKALADAIDAVGGVEVNVTKEESYAMDSNEYHVLSDTIENIGRKAKRVRPGEQTLDGVQAVAYCRIRHNAGDDFGRAKRQREVLAKLIEKVKSGGIAKINNLMDVVFPEVSTSLSTNQIIALATRLKGYEMEKMEAYPFDKKSTTLGVAGSVLVPCTLESNARLAYKFLYRNEEYEPSEALQKISKRIRNTTGFNEEDAVDYGDNGKKRNNRQRNRHNNVRSNAQKNMKKRINYNNGVKNNNVNKIVNNAEKKH